MQLCPGTLDARLRRRCAAGCKRVARTGHASDGRADAPCPRAAKATRRVSSAECPSAAGAAAQCDAAADGAVDAGREAAANRQAAFRRSASVAASAAPRRYDSAAAISPARATPKDACVRRGMAAYQGRVERQFADVAGFCDRMPDAIGVPKGRGAPDARARKSRWLTIAIARDASRGTHAPGDECMKRRRNNAN